MQHLGRPSHAASSMSYVSGPGIFVLQSLRHGRMVWHMPSENLCGAVGVGRSVSMCVGSRVHIHGLNVVQRNPLQGRVQCRHTRPSQGALCVLQHRAQPHRQGSTARQWCSAWPVLHLSCSVLEAQHRGHVDGGGSDKTHLAFAGASPQCCGSERLNCRE